MDAAQVALALDPAARQNGDGWICRCPAHDDAHASLSLSAGSGGKLLWHCHAGCSQEDVCAELKRRGLLGKPNGADRSAKPASWCPILPVPDDARAPGFLHGKHGRPSATWRYRDAEGRPLFYVARFDLADGGKEILPRSYGTLDGKRGWHWKAPPSPRPLYGLDRLAKRPKASVLVVEGEKATMAARKLVPDRVVVTWQGGNEAVGKADWSALKGRDVVIWPDHDKPGHKAAAAVAGALQGIASEVRLVALPSDLPDGWDLADPLPDDLDVDVGALIAMSVEKLKKAGQRAKQPSTAAQLVQIALKGAKLFTTPADRTPYAVFESDGHREVWPLRSRGFKSWLARQLFQKTKRIAAAQALADALTTLEGTALFDGEVHLVHLRVAEHEGAYYLDLADAEWRAVMISLDGWKVVKRPPVYFRRTRGTLPLPKPERDGDLAELLTFLNVTPADFRMVLAWVLAAARPVGPYPVLDLLGEQGAAKTTTARVLRRLIDPAEPMVRAAPREERDLAIAVLNSHVLALDNLSHIQPWLSDALCRFATGGGWACRSLYTDDDEVLIFATRPIILTGIEELAQRPDLKDRTIAAELPSIREERRLEESLFWQRFDDAHPALLGALLDTMAAGLARLPTLRLKRLPRMADFAKWVTACEPALGWPNGTFIQAYADNRAQLTESILEGNETIDLIRRHQRCHKEFKSVTALLKRLRALCEDDPEKLKALPKTPRGLSGLLRRYTPELRAVGIEITFGQRGEHGVPVKITRPEKRPAERTDVQDTQKARKTAAFRAVRRLCVEDDDAQQRTAPVRRNGPKTPTHSQRTGKKARKTAAPVRSVRPVRRAAHSSHHPKRS